MNILTSQLPSGGYGYNFPSVNVSPMNFLQICNYVENCPAETQPLERYLYDINMLCEEDPKIQDCYLMDIDFLIFYKKLCTISGDLNYNITVRCPHCGEKINKPVAIDKDIHFKGVDEKVMNGAKIELGGKVYDTIIPTFRQFMRVFQRYLVYKKITDLKMIKTIALIDDNGSNGNQIEDAVLGAKHEDITLLLALRELYYDRIEPIEVTCPNCSKDKKVKVDKTGRRGVVTVSVENLAVDFFPDIINNNPIDGSKVLFK